MAKRTTTANASTNESVEVKPAAAEAEVTIPEAEPAKSAEEILSESEALRDTPASQAKSCLQDERNRATPSGGLASLINVLGSLLQTNNPITGGALDCGIRPVATEVALFIGR